MAENKDSCFSERKLLKELDSYVYHSDTEVFQLIENLILNKDLKLETVTYWGRSNARYLFDIFVFFTFWTSIFALNFLWTIPYWEMALAYVVSFIVIGIIAAATESDFLFDNLIRLYFSWFNIFQKPKKILQIYNSMKKKEEKNKTSSIYKEKIIKAGGIY